MHIVYERSCCSTNIRSLFSFFSFVLVSTHVACSKMDFERSPYRIRIHSFVGGVIELRIHLIAAMVDVSRFSFSLSLCSLFSVRRFTFMCTSVCDVFHICHQRNEFAKRVKQPTKVINIIIIIIAIAIAIAVRFTTPKR